jgi:hypothetical protein
MADGAAPDPAPSRLFIVETTGAPDALLRVLSVCAIRQVAPSAVTYAGSARGGVVRIEAGRMDEGAVERLASRLQSEPMVIGVTVGWRAQA